MYLFGVYVLGEFSQIYIHIESPPSSREGTFLSPPKIPQAPSQLIATPFPPAPGNYWSISEHCKLNSFPQILINVIP